MITADKIFSEVQLGKFLKRLRIEKDRSVAIIKAANRLKPSEVRTIIDCYLFTLIAQTGLRISEALSLRRDDIHADFLVVRPEVSKNRTKGTVYFGPRTRKLLTEFTELKTELFKKALIDPIFSLNGKLLSRSYCHTRFKKWLNVEGLPRSLSIHSLRHTYGTLCLDKGLSLTFVRDNLRHSNIAVTSQYLHLTRENREKIRDLF